MSDATETLNDLSRKEDGQAGPAVKERVSSCEQANQIAQKFFMDDQARAARRLKVQGMFDGNAPKSQQEMAAAQRDGYSNINWKEHRGTVMNAWNPYFDLVCEIPVCIDGRLEAYGSDIDQELMRGFAQNFHDMVFGWEDFDQLNQLRDLQMLLHGPGPIMWEDEWNPFPGPVLASDFYVDSMTKSTFSNCEVAMVTSYVKVGTLWKEIEDPRRATAMKWNVEAVRDTIMNASTSQDLATLGKSWDRWEQMFKNGDIWASTVTKNIKIANMFVREMDGKISHLVFTYSQDAAPKEFLYKNIGRYDCWKECIQAFMYDIGADGTFHSVKGLGTDIYPFCALYSKINNHIADLVCVGVGPMFQVSEGKRIEEFSMIKWGPGNLIPNGISPMDLNISRGIQPAIEASREFKNTMGQNNGSYSQGDLAPPTVEETAKSAVIRAMERAKLTKGSHNRFYRSLDLQYAEMWRRATKPGLQKYHLNKNPEVARIVMEFRDKCFELCDKLGVPKEALQKVRHVRASRSLGLGSPAMRVEIANAIMEKWAILPDEASRRNALRAYLAAITSYANVEAFAPSLISESKGNQQEWEASVEDNSLSTGGVAVLTPTQDDVIHLESHIGSAEMDIELVMQGQADPREVVQRLFSKGSHSWKHMARLEGNPMRKQEYAMFADRLKSIGAIQDQLEQNIEEQDQAAAEQEQPAVDPEVLKVTGKLQLQAAKQEADIARKAQKQRFDEWIAIQKLQADTRIKAGETVAKIGIDRFKAVNSNGSTS